MPAVPVTRASSSVTAATAPPKGSGASVKSAASSSLTRPLPSNETYDEKGRGRPRDEVERLGAEQMPGEELTCVVGTLGDGGETIAKLESDHGFGPGAVDFVFLDHAKDAYLPDLLLMEERGWLHPGSVAVADNVKLPGAPEYRDYMRSREGKTWRTTCS